MAAYRTAARLFVGSHLPLLCMGMESFLTNSLPLADQVIHTAAHTPPTCPPQYVPLTLAPQYLRQSREVCAADPLVYNELAVVMYRTGRFKEAVELLGLVVNLTRSSAQHLRPMWEPVWFNLGHAQRKLGYVTVAMCVCVVVTSYSAPHSTVLSTATTRRHWRRMRSAWRWMHSAPLPTLPLALHSCC